MERVLTCIFLAFPNLGPWVLFRLSRSAMAEKSTWSFWLCTSAARNLVVWFRNIGPPRRKLAGFGLNILPITKGYLELRIMWFFQMIMIFLKEYDHIFQWLPLFFVCCWRSFPFKLVVRGHGRFSKTWRIAPWPAESGKDGTSSEPSWGGLPESISNNLWKRKQERLFPFFLGPIFFFSWWLQLVDNWMLDTLEMWLLFETLKDLLFSFAASTGRTPRLGSEDPVAPWTLSGELVGGWWWSHGWGCEWTKHIQ